MWIFTKYGFFSATCVKEDDKTIQVRGRVEDHLRNLKVRFPELTGEIIVGEGTDYLFRIYVPKEIWAKVIAELANEVDYSNFKSEVGKNFGYKDEYSHSLMTVWSTMYKLQK